MYKRIISMLIAVCMLVPILATLNLPALAAEGDLPATMWVEPTEGSGIPVRIELNRSSGSGGGGCGGFPGGGGTTSSGYQLYLPGNADPAECFFSWDDGLEASDGTNSYASGALPVPTPGETKTFTFSKDGASATFQVTVYQGSQTVPPTFIQIDESQGTIAAMNGDDDHNTTCTGTIFVDGVEYNMPTIKGRGNSSWMTARTKKPYNVTLDAKVKLLDIDSDKTKKWSLLANCDEPSLLRDQLGYDMAHEMGVGLDTAQTDVWMNGKYLGLYLLTPKYDSFVPKDGFLIENDNYKEDPVEEGGDPSFDLEGLIGQGSAQQYYNYNRITVKKIGDNLLGGEETVETLKAAGEQIRVYTQEVWDAIRSADGYNSQGGYYADYIDMESWAIMYLLQDYIKNYDFCGGSIFFHREGQEETDKLFAGPLWDLDLGFGCPQNSDTLGRNLDLLDGSGWFVRNVADTKTSIYKVVGKHADFMDCVSRMYNAHRAVFDTAPAHLEELAEAIQASAEMNQVVTSNEQASTLRMTGQRVVQRGTQYEQTYKATNNWRDYVDNVKTFTVARSAFFRDNLASDECEHEYEAAVTPPTCTEKGYTTYTCAKCGDSYQADETAALGHDYMVVVTAPTCTDAGFTTYTCSRCGDSYRADETAVLGHAWDAGVVTKQPTETAAGERTYTCTRCGQKRTEVIPMLEHVHSYTAVVTAPTCTEAGFTTHTCACGDSYVDAETPALGHDYKAVGPAPEPTCASFTTIVYKCPRCGDTIEEEIAPMPHDYKAVVTAPTCTEGGYTTYTCSRCNDSYKSDETAALGHSFGEWTISKAATCTAEGEEARACTRCDAKETRAIEKIAHNYVDGKCTVCGAADPDYKPPVDYTDLNALIAAAEAIDRDKYTAESLAALDVRIAGAKAARTSGDQDVVISNAAALEAAIKALVEKPEPFRFDDVQNPDDYFFAPVYWAYEHDPQITKGTSEKLFSPNAGCTRAQVVTFLWRALGEPEPEKKENPFKDVAEGQYYYNAVLWAVEKGVTTGTSADKFSPNATCTRGQIVTFLWRAMDKPAPKNTTNPFTDVPAGQYYTDAVLWAVENNITTGTSKTTFRPGNTCTRGQIVTFLWRALPEKAD